MPKKQTLEFHRTVKAAPSEVYLALTNASALREWFCDTAQIEPHRGGRVYFTWNQGYYAAGEITKLKDGKKVAFTWHGRGEPDQTEVEIAVTSKKDGSSVTVLHGGVGAGAKWKAAGAEIRRGWERGLENLASVLDDGQDLRYTLRPMLGIDGFEELTAAMAERLAVPVRRGVRIDGTMPGLAAEAAGLQKDDVLVSVGGHKVVSPSGLVTVLDAYRAGDKAPVTYYHGAEKRKATLELSKRASIDIPGSAAEMAETARKSYELTDAELNQAIADISPKAAKARSAAGEWNVREILAHLLHRERDFQTWIAELVADNERIYDAVTGNSHLRTSATAETFGTARALFLALKHSQTESVAMLAALPDEFVNRKRSYWRLAKSVAQSESAFHTRDHLRQIGAASAAPAQPGQNNAEDP